MRSLSRVVIMGMSGTWDGAAALAGRGQGTLVVTGH